MGSRTALSRPHDESGTWTATPKRPSAGSPRHDPDRQRPPHRGAARARARGAGAPGRSARVLARGPLPGAADPPRRRLVLAIADPTNLHVADDLRLALGMSFRCAVAESEQLERVLRRVYGQRQNDDPLRRARRDLRERASRDDGRGPNRARAGAREPDRRREGGADAFARGLRTILRSDPDVLLVGEVRDEETASIAMSPRCPVI